MVKFARTAGAAVVAALLALSATAPPGFAHSKQYCRSYANDVANNNANAGNVVAGTVLGAATGALLGAAIGGHNSVGKGALIGGVGGTVAGGVYTGDKWHRVYNDAYARCRAS